MMKEHQFSYIFCYVTVSAQPKLSSELRLHLKHPWAMSHFIVALTESSANLWEVCNVLPHSFLHPKFYWQFVISLVAMKIVSAEYKFWSVHHAD